MDDDSATEMDSNHPLSGHHQTHHPHHLDVSSLNDAKKRPNNHHQVTTKIILDVLVRERVTMIFELLVSSNN